MMDNLQSCECLCRMSGEMCQERLVQIAQSRRTLAGGSIG